MTVTTEEYREAKKIIREQEKILAQWNKQQSVGKYSFLYWFEDSPEGGESREYKAKNINQACKKFAKYLLNRKRILDRVDYEVLFNDETIDISEIKCMQDYL